LTPVANCRPGFTAINVNLGKDVTTTVVDTVDKFSASRNNDTGGQLASGVVDTGGAP
jgi:hypothetical protein